MTKGTVWISTGTGTSHSNKGSKLNPSTAALHNEATHTHKKRKNKQTNKIWSHKLLDSKPVVRDEVAELSVTRLTDLCSEISEQIRGELLCEDKT